MRVMQLESRKELWFWRVTSAGAISLCAVLLLQPTRASTVVREDAREGELEGAPDFARQRSREAYDTGRVRAFLASLERASSNSLRCQLIDRVLRLPELDEAGVAQVARYTEASHPLELRRCTGHALGGVTQQAAFEPLKALAQCDRPSLVETALVALASRPDPASRELAIALSAKERSLRVAVAVALAEAFAMEAMPLLASLLDDGNERDRERLLVALGRTGDPRAIGLLQGYLAHGNRAAQHSVIYALGEIGGRAATDTLLSVLRDRPQFAQVAANALARAGGDEAREALLEIAAQGGGYGAGLAALQALTDFDGPGVHELMEGALRGAPQAQYVAIEYFVNRQDQAALPVLEQLARDGSLQSAPQALQGLARLGGDQALDVLDEVANAGGPPSAMALTILNQSEPSRAQEIALAQVRSGNPGALDVLSGDDSPEARLALGKLVRDGDSSTAGRAMYALAQRDDPEALKLIESTAKSEDPQRRQAALWALAQTGDPAVLKTLRNGLSDSDDSVRREAVQALAQFGGPEAEAALFTATHDKSAEVVATAATQLAQIGTPSALDRIEQIARVPETAGQGLMALVGTAPARAQPLIETMVDSSDPQARRAALLAAGSLPSEVGTRLVIDALQQQDVERVREALETAAHNYQTPQLRDALRALSTRDLPDDLKLLAKQIAGS
jgi:HEAT repeat protein